MLISKHHYAMTLAASGNKVYFVNPPNDPLPAEKISVKPSGIHDNLYIVSHRISFPYRLKFHALPVFHWFMRGHIKQLLGKIGRPDIVWSFDIGYFYPFRFFPEGCIKIFHPVDEPTLKIGIDAARGADIIFSVTEEILEKYRHLPVPRHFINHGLATGFLEGHAVGYADTGILKAGFSGNLLRNDLDREIFIRIIDENPSVRFECWGSYKVSDSNIGGGADAAQQLFIKRLSAFNNVVLHGSVPVKKLASELNRMDLFLICYDVERDQSKGTNYHKVMEYLSTGKVIVSNNISTYKSRKELVTMIEDRHSNESLPALFKEVAQNIDRYNSPEAVERRRQFAADNTYSRQVERIDACLEKMKKI